MKFTKEQQRAAYKKLPEDVRDFVFSNEVNDLIDEIKKEIGLTEEQSAVADVEILYSLIGLQNITSSIEEIAKVSNKQRQDLTKISQKLQSGIFDNIKDMGINLEEFVLSNKSERINPGLQNKPITPETHASSEVFEPKIETPAITPTPKTTAVEIPPANLPRIEPGEVVHDTKPQTAPPVVETKPTIPQPVQKSSIPVPPKPANSHYPDGQDPYREPTV